MKFFNLKNTKILLAAILCTSTIVFYQNCGAGAHHTSPAPSNEYSLSDKMDLSKARPLEAEGEVSVMIEDYKDHAKIRHILKTDAGDFELHYKKKAPHLTTGSKVKVSGLMLENNLSIDESSSSSMQVLTAGELPNAIGVQSVAVIMVNFSDDTAQPITAAAIHDQVFNITNNFLKENSDNQTSLSGAVFGWYTIPLSKTICDPSQISALADQAATSAGANLANYSRKFYAFPKNACTWAGLADVGGASTRAYYNGKFDLDNFGHEFGHNLGLFHSHGLDCDVSALGNVCTPLSYGDAADIMGNLEGHYNSFQKERLGWLSGLTVVSASGRYTLTPYENGSGTRSLKIPKGLDSSGKQIWYYLEYRQPIGADNILSYYGNLNKGVSIRLGTSNDADSSYLLDMTPNSDTSSGFVDLWDSSLMATKNYSDSAASVAVNVVSTDTASAIVDITFGGAPPPPPPPPSDTTAPTVSISSPANGAKVTINSTITISANASDNVGVSKVEFYVNNSLKCTDVSAPYSCSYKVPKGAGKTYNLKATATDAANNSSSHQISVISSR